MQRPAGASVFTAADLGAVKPIRPMLHKFNYVPISQPVLAKDVVRFVGEPIAAVVAASPEEAEDFADLVEVEIEEMPAVVDAREALRARAPARARRGAGERRRRRPRQDSRLRRGVARAHRRIKVDIRSAPAECAAAGAARGACGMGPRRTGA